MKKVICLLLIVCLLNLALATAEGGIVIRLIDNADVGVTLSDGCYPMVRLTAAYPIVMLTGHAEPLWLSFPAPEGASITAFSPFIARYVNAKLGLRTEYAIMTNTVVAGLPSKLQNPGHVVIDEDDIVAGCDPETNETWCLMTAKPLGEDVALRVGMTFELDPRLSEAERLDFLSAAIQQEAARVRDALQYEVVAPFWNVDVYDGAELLDPTQRGKLSVAFPALTKDIGGQSIAASRILARLQGWTLEFYYVFDQNNSLQCSIELVDTDGTIPQTIEDDPNWKQVTLDNGSQWLAKLVSKDGGIGAWDAVRTFPVDGDKPLYALFSVVKRGDSFAAWADEAAVLDDLLLFDEGIAAAPLVDETPEPEPVAADAEGWLCPECGTENVGNFCVECGSPKPVSAAWTCPNCGTENEGKFCTECGSPKPVSGVWACPSCGAENEGKFCTECGTPRP